MRNLIILFFVCLAITVSSCRQDFVFEPSTGDLFFSKDTVYLDTVFTNIGSSTYTLKVYNRSNKDIKIPTIQLGKGQNSKYRMTVDGMTGENNRIFHDVELLAKDSMYIFIEVTSDVADANPTDFLYTDQIQFDSGDNFQKVELVTLIQDAYFIFPQRSGVNEDFIYETVNFGVNDDAENVIAIGSNLDHSDPINGDEYTWGNTKPYVVYGYAFVPDGEILTVNPGARVHFHANSGLVIGKNAVLKINGGLSTTEALENEVIFEGDRLEPEFSNVPGQWGAIINYSTSTNNSINHLTLKNATIGILSNNLATITDTASPYLKIQNSQIYDCSNFGLLARKSNIECANLVINNAGQATLACTYGGTYNFTHCTFNNNWSSSNQVAVLVNNNLETDDTIYVKDLVAANFNNCIIYGGNQVEMILDNVQSDTVTSLFNYKFNHCLIRFNNISNQFTSNPLYQFTTDSIHYVNCSIATNSSTFNPKFEDESLNQLWLSEDLNLPNDISFTTLYPFDINSNDRTTSTDLGAYQFIP
jgi:hypothetical protein